MTTRVTGPLQLPLTDEISSDRRSDEAFIYVLRYSNDVIKVGTTLDPRGRFRHHVMNAGVFDVTIDDLWMSGPHLNATKNEWKVLEACAAHPSVRRIGKEEFSRISFDWAVGVAEQMPFARAAVRDPGPDQFYNLAEVAKMTGLPIAEIRRVCAEGRVEHVRVTSASWIVKAKHIKEIRNLLDLPASRGGVDAPASRCVVVSGLVSPRPGPGTT